MVLGGRPRIPNRGDLLDVTCWCEMFVVPVPADDVRAGRTHSCGDAMCGPGCNRRGLEPIDRNTTGSSHRRQMAERPARLRTAA